MTTTTRVERDRAAEFQPERRRLFGRAAGLGLIGLGAGLLGIEVFKCIMKDPRFENMPLVLETPNEEIWAQEIKQLMEMAG